jgi:hypothetical protein
VSEKAADHLVGDMYVTRVRWRDRLIWNWWRAPFPHLLSRWEVRIIQAASYTVPDGRPVGPLHDGWAGFSSFRRRPAEDWLYEVAGATDDEADAWIRACRQAAAPLDLDAWLEAYRAQNKD